MAETKISDASRRMGLEAIEDEESERRVRSEKVREMGEVSDTSEFDDDPRE